MIIARRRSSQLDGSPSEVQLQCQRETGNETTKQKRKKKTEKRE